MAEGCVFGSWDVERLVGSELFGFNELEDGEFGVVGVEFGGVGEEVGDGVAGMGGAKAKSVVESRVGSNGSVGLGIFLGGEKNKG